MKKKIENCFAVTPLWSCWMTSYCQHKILGLPAYILGAAAVHNEKT